MDMKPLIKNKNKNKNRYEALIPNFKLCLG